MAQVGPLANQDFEAIMQDFVNTFVLICAAIAALGFGVVLAFWICHAGFAIMRSQVRPRQENSIPAKPRAVEA
jgi:ABC-type transporter Mla maintaining outer membrane lipid asymmetry permease subunit MlaE